MGVAAFRDELRGDHGVRRLLVPPPLLQARKQPPYISPLTFTLIRHSPSHSLARSRYVSLYHLSYATRKFKPEKTPGFGRMCQYVLPQTYDRLLALTLAY